MSRQSSALLAILVAVFPAMSAGAGEPAAVLRILPLGDSITRGSYITRYETGPRKGQAMSMANPGGGGWRRLLQDRLRADGIAYDFVGELRYHSFGHDGIVDPDFDPDHHGLAGFGNRQLMSGGKVPTLPDALDAMGVSEVVVPDLATVLRKHRPDVILLMSGTNGFDAPARDELIRLIGAHSAARLFVATILPQRPPRADPVLTEQRYATLMERAAWEKVDEFNASLPAVVTAQQAAGHRVTLVDMHRAFSPDDLLADGVHPNFKGLERMAATWYGALKSAGYAGRNRFQLPPSP